MKEVTSFLESIKGFKSVPKEGREEYRNFFFRSDLAQSRMVLIILTVAIAIFGLSDYPILGLSTIFVVVEALRLLVIVYSVLTISRLNRSSNYRSYDRTLFIYLLVFIVFSLFVNATRPQGFAIQAIIVGISVFAFYLALPTKFLNQAVLSTINTIGELALMFAAMQFAQVPETLAVLLSLIFANLIAGVASWQFNYYRWLVFKDLNERKKNERFVVIGQTAGMVGHDIRNPLQSITGDLYLIEEALKENPSCTSEDIAESINAISENIGYINKIISDLQDYTRTLNLNVTVVKLKDLFVDRVSHLSKNIVTQVIVNDELSIKTDATYLRRIVNNLVINAVQAMPQGGKLTLQAIAQGGRVLIKVKDTGVGIAEEIKPNLFKPMFTTKAKGQGLGLAVVKRLVEALHGTITFESHVGKGTTFTINLPLS